MPKGFIIDILGRGILFCVAIIQLSHSEISCLDNVIIYYAAHIQISLFPLRSIVAPAPALFSPFKVPEPNTGPFIVFSIMSIQSR